LVGNAIKFTEEGAVSVNYTLQKQTDNRSLIRVEVKDSGIGLTSEQQSKLFTRFSQADSSTTRQYGGTGLGLAICKRLVELMGGEIGVTSSLGNGSTFWFTLVLSAAINPPSTPVIPESQNTKSIDQPESTIASLPQFEGVALIVEDNAVNQFVAQTQLEDFGLQIKIAENGKEALSMLEKNHFDIVLMDCQMPVMDGFEAAHEIRNSQSDVLNHAIPIVAMTANAMQGDREKCVSAGMDDYITKPVCPEDIQRVLGRWLAQPRNLPSNV
ncbi:MAG: response regulator, partial [Pseudomonadales bacterium]|nr:response regulator [Pseudomonadales bacterium]